MRNSFLSLFISHLTEPEFRRAGCLPGIFNDEEIFMFENIENGWLNP
jgi:hypothetical protein